MPREIFGPRRYEVTAGDWGDVRGGNIHDLGFLPNIIRVIK